MISYREIRESLVAWPKYPGCEPVLRAPLITRGFPGTFNMSSTEHHWLASLGGYVDWADDCIFTTIQSCVRLNDFPALPTGAGRRYLGVFEMADLSGEIALAVRPDYTEALAWQYRELARFCDGWGIPLERMYASYCAGGPVAALTAGKYRFDFDVPVDEPTRKAFVAAGFPAENLIPDRTRDTLLSLHVHRPTPWGYRSETFIELDDGHLLDLATSEYLVWNPTFSGAPGKDTLNGLTPIENGYYGIAFGVERLAMAINHLPRVHDIDCLAGYYRLLGERLGRPVAGEDYVTGEALRALHRIITDRDHHPEAAVTVDAAGARSMGLKRRKKAAMLKRAVSASLDEAALRELLAAHAADQPWHAHLDETVETTVREILTYRASQGRRHVAA